MGRGVSCGGGESSLGYLFGGGGDTANASKPTPATPKPTGAEKAATATPPCNEASPASSSSSIDKQTAAGINGKPKNNYFRVDGQNCGNFLTDRPSTKVHSAPGGGSSLGYLFGGGTNGGN